MCADPGSIAATAISQNQALVNGGATSPSLSSVYSPLNRPLAMSHLLLPLNDTSVLFLQPKLVTEDVYTPDPMITQLTVKTRQ